MVEQLHRKAKGGLFGDLMRDMVPEVSWSQIVEDLYNQALKFRLQPGQLMKKFMLGIRETDVHGKEGDRRGVVSEKKNEMLRGQQIIHLTNIC